MGKLSNQLDLLDQSQLDTVTFLAGVDQNGTVPASGTWNSWAGDNATTWQSKLGTGASQITFGFATADDGSTFSATTQSNLAQALALWSDIANINFNFTADLTKADVVIVQSGKIYNKGTIGAGTLYQQNNSIPTATKGLDEATQGQINLDLSGPFGDPSSYTTLAGYGVNVLVHEVGHLLGLGHSGPYNQTGTVAVDYGPQQNNDTDVRTWSIMSYIDPRDKTAPGYNKYDPSSYDISTNPTGTNWTLPTESLDKFGNDTRAPFTPMGLDIFAAQRLYGAPINGRLAGGQIFGFNSNIKFTDIDGSQQSLSMYDFSQNTVPVVTLYDTGTDNTLDLSGFTQASTVDLNPGAWTSAAGLNNNIFIEYGTAIDGAVGGTQDDRFTLNSDGDRINGGDGTDTAIFPNARSAYSFDYGNGGSVTLTDTTTGHVNTLTNLEQTIFTDRTVAVADLSGISWTGGPKDDHFNNKENWDLNQVPGPGSDVVINIATPSRVINAPTNEVDSLTIGANGTLIIESGQFIVDNGAKSSVNSGEIDVNAQGTQVSLYIANALENDGTLRLLGPDAELITNSTTASITGSGTIAMTRGNIGGRTFADATPFDTLVSTNLIHGSGVIGLDQFINSITFINQATVDADDVLPLTLFGAVVNQGLLSGSSGLAGLILDGTVDNTGGVISALDGGSVLFDTVTVSGGAISAIGSGKLDVTTNTTLDGTASKVSLDGTLVVDSGATVTLTGTVSGGSIDATQGTLKLAGAVIDGVQLSGHIGFGGGGNTIYAGGFSTPPVIFSNGLTIGAGAVLTLASNPHDGGNGFGNPQTIALEGKGATLIIDRIATFSGGGTIKLSDPSDVIAGAAINPLFVDDVVNIDNKITGQGLIYGLAIENLATGSIIASGGTLTLDSTTHEIKSDGFIGAEDGADLVIIGTLDQQDTTLNGIPGTPTLGNTGTITLGGTVLGSANAGTIQGGTIPAGGIVEIAAPGGDLTGVTINGLVSVDGDATFTLGSFAGDTVNNGTIELNGFFDGTLHHGATLAPVGDRILKGNGRIHLVNAGDPNSATDDTIRSLNNADTLENAGNLIDGYGLLGGTYLNLINRATIMADRPNGDLIIDAGSMNGTLGVIGNAGLMLAQGGTLAVQSGLLDYALIKDFIFGTLIPSGAGDIGAFGSGSTVELRNGASLDAGRLWSADGGVFAITGNSTLSGGSVFFPTGATALNATDIIVNTVTEGEQSNAAAAGLADGRIVVAWDDSGTNGSDASVVQLQVLDRFGVKLGGTFPVQTPVVGETQSHAKIAALNGGFVVTWLQTDVGGGTTTLRAAIFNADLSVANSGFTVSETGTGAPGLNVAALPGGGFAVVWSNPAAAGTASALRLQLYNANGTVNGSPVDLASSGLAPSIAAARDGSGGFAVAWTAPDAGGGEGTVFAQFFSSDGTPFGSPVTVGSGDSAYIAPSVQNGSFTVFWNDPVNHAGVPQGQAYTSNGLTTGSGNTASELDYSGLYTATSTLLPDGRIATIEDHPEGGSSTYNDVGLALAAPTPVNDALVSYADVEVQAGQTLTLSEGISNAGLIALHSGDAAGAVLAITGTAYLGGIGTIELGGASATIAGATGADELDNHGNTIQGQGRIGANGLIFSNSGTVNATAGTLTIDTGTGKLINNATLEASTGTLSIVGDVINQGIIEANGGFVQISGAVADKDFFTGYLQINAGKIVVAGSVGVTQNVEFSSASSGTLELQDPLHMQGSIVELFPGNTIDLDGIVADSFVRSGQQLNLLSGGNQVASLNVTIISQLGTVALHPDGHGGTMINLETSTVVLPRTLLWTGASSNSFATAGNWNDITDNLNPALSAPGTLDTSGFTSAGGTITGTGSAGRMFFSGGSPWIIADGADLVATGPTGITIGSSTGGSVTVNGALSTSSFASSIVVSASSGKTATTVVSGKTAMLASANVLSVGVSGGSGALSVQNGATAAASEGRIGVGSAATQGTLDIEGAGSLLQITDELDVGDFAGTGTGVITLGAGATLSVGTTFHIGATGTLHQQGGLIDPITFSNDGTIDGTGTTVADGMFSNSGTVTVTGDYVINAPTLAGDGTLMIAGGDLTLQTGSVDAAQSIEFTGTSGTLTLAGDAIANFAATIGNMRAGDNIVVQNATIAATSFDASKHELTLYGPSGELGTLQFGSSVTDGSAISLNDVTPARTMVWTGAHNTAFTNALNWNDVSSAANPSVTPPTISDLAQFTSGGGTIHGSGEVALLQFGGDGDWIIPSDSELTADVGVTVASAKSGRLVVEGTIHAGSTATDNTLHGFAIGDSGNGPGEVEVAGTAALLSNSGRFVIGGTDFAGLSISAGGTAVSTPDGNSGGADIAAQAGSDGSSVKVTGAGSKWQINGALHVGDAAFGSLAITEGGAVSATSLSEGVLPDSAGIVSVIGQGSSLTLGGTLLIGAAASAELYILSGAAVSALNTDIGGQSSATGNVDIEGTGSHLDVANDLNIGVAGVGVLTLGNNTELTVVNNLNIGANGVLNSFGGIIDPAVVNNTGRAGGKGQISASVSIVNSGTLFAANGTETLVAPIITSTGVLEIDPAGNLVVNVGSVVATQTVTFTDGSGILTIGTLGGFAATIGSFNEGDLISIPGTAIATTQFDSGTHVLTLFNGSAQVAGTLQFGPSIANGSMISVNGVTPCFLAGTRIGTERGEVCIEDLQVGDRVQVTAGEAQPVVWLGQRRIDCTRHSDPRKIWPVRVMTEAFGPGRPARDLWLSPDHALYLGGVLIPVKHLINGTSIAQMAVEKVTYYHVELPRHAVLLAEGLPAESYLDTGDRSNFTNGNGPVALHPDFASRHWEAEGCAPLVIAGPELEAARRWVAGVAVAQSPQRAHDQPADRRPRQASIRSA